ncbi:DNA-binding transcriptional LysR family regulator [Sphingomonas jinjuensis]|uniref:DNA-binding transcriptional LysR family regulator n=1 Tax=Sphingomonas jinjuensis TaxID=535907 RepID=A0A840F8X7_9SPHN|nr:LysR family transcriptional regulator [Sphingomonas jinjuensis]MBB4152746.1 DNA-binding transcriptional LysR family regulator [Sphingomonas jinjuensis]
MGTARGSDRKWAGSQDGAALMPVPDWDDLRLFLAVGRAGGLSRAARHLRVDQTTVARRLAALEETLAIRLANRTPRGIQLTDAGQALLARAERIEVQVLAAQAEASAGDTMVRGTVRIATPETLGTHIIAPNAAALRDAHPHLRLELVPESRDVRLANRDADIAITLRLPDHGPLHARRLADYDLGLYAAPSYLSAWGTPRTIGDLASHRMVGYIEDLVDLPQLRVEGPVAPVIFRSTSSAAQYAAVVGGTGLGWLHSYVAAEDPRLVRVLASAAEKRSYWLSVHRDQRAMPAVRAVIDFLDDLARRLLPGEAQTVRLNTRIDSTAPDGS